MVAYMFGTISFIYPLFECLGSTASFDLLENKTYEGKITEFGNLKIFTFPVRFCIIWWIWWGQDKAELRQSVHSWPDRTLCRRSGVSPTRPPQSQIWPHPGRTVGVWRLPHSLLLCLLNSRPDQLEPGTLQSAGEKIFPLQLDPQ